MVGKDNSSGWMIASFYFCLAEFLVWDPVRLVWINGSIVKQKVTNARIQAYINAGGKETHVRRYCDRQWYQWRLGSKRLCEKGLKTLVLERKSVQHIRLSHC